MTMIFVDKVRRDSVQAVCIMNLARCAWTQYLYVRTTAPSSKTVPPTPDLAKDSLPWIVMSPKVRRSGTPFSIDQMLGMGPHTMVVGALS